GHVRVVLDDLVAERAPGHRTRRPHLGRLAQGRGHRWTLPLIRIRRAGWLERELVVDAVQSGGDQPGNGEVRVDVATRHTMLEPQRGAVADDPQRTRAVVESPGQRGRSERLGLIALVRVDVRSGEKRQLALTGQLTREEVLHHGGETVGTITGKHGRVALVPKAEVHATRVALTLGEFRREAERRTLPRSHLL